MSGQQVVGAVRAVGRIVADVKAYLQRKKDLDANRQHRLQQGKVSGEYEKPRQA